MNIKKPRFYLVAASALSILFSCAPQVIYAKKDHRPPSPARGEKLWASTCYHCHSLPNPDKLNAKHWRVTMAHMRTQAQLTGDEARDILAFLTEGDSSEETNKTDIPAPAPQQKTDKHTKSSEPNKPKDPSELNKAKPKTRSGKTIYYSDCSVCHGTTSQKGIPQAPGLTDSTVFLSKSTDELLSIIKKGIGAMPARGGHPDLTDEELKAAIEYIRSVAKENS